MDRRQFLKATGFLTASVATLGLGACNGGDSGSPGGAYTFDEGVASGDPRADGVILWTRVTRTDGKVGDVDLRVQVALDAGFYSGVADVSITASAAFDNTVRHKLTGLNPGSTYYYRFIAGADVSATGRTKTAPGSNADIASLKFAFITCQDYSVNHWAALDALAAEDIDFVVHLGDYIYDSIPATQILPVENAHGPLTLPKGALTPNDSGTHAVALEDYRYLYRKYRSDPRLQKLHAQFPMIAIWSDHEFTNDAWGDHSTYTNANQEELARRRNANQAWFEYMPADVAFDANNPAFDNIRIYRDFAFGQLIHLVMTDERLYRSDHVIDETLVAPAQGRPFNPSGDDQIGSRYFVDRDAMSAIEAQKLAAGVPVTMLGATQEDWWRGKMTGSSAVWKIWGNEVSLLRMQFDLRSLAPAPLNKVFIMNADQWDGYNSARKRLVGFLKDSHVTNVVAITGDVHAFAAGQVLDDYDSPNPTPAAVDLVTAGISSTPFFYTFAGPARSDPRFQALAPLIFTVDASGNVINTFNGTLRAMNPWIKFADTQAIGYALVSVTKTELMAQFKKFRELTADRSVPTAVASVTTLRIAAGSTDIAVST